MVQRRRQVATAGGAQMVGSGGMVSAAARAFNGGLEAEPLALVEASGQGAKPPLKPKVFDHLGVKRRR